jgi:hypothetical protein
VKDQNKARRCGGRSRCGSSRRRIGDLIRGGKLLEVHCSSCRPARHLYIDVGSLDLPKRLPEVPFVEPPLGRSLVPAHRGMWSLRCSHHKKAPEGRLASGACLRAIGSGSPIY